MNICFKLLDIMMWSLISIKPSSMHFNKTFTVEFSERQPAIVQYFHHDGKPVTHYAF